MHQVDTADDLGIRRRGILDISKPFAHLVAFLCCARIAVLRPAPLLPVVNDAVAAVVVEDAREKHVPQADDGRVVVGADVDVQRGRLRELGKEEGECPVAAQG